MCDTQHFFLKNNSLQRCHSNFSTVHDGTHTKTGKADWKVEKDWSLGVGDKFQSPSSGYSGSKVFSPNYTKAFWYSQFVRVFKEVANFGLSVDLYNTAVYDNI